MGKLQMRTDAEGRSLWEYGTPDFPFAHYRDELALCEENRIDWHWHRSFELTLVERGVLTLRLLTETHTLQAGDMLFLNSGTIHCFEDGGGCVLKDLIFAPELLAAPDGRVYREHIVPVQNSCQSFAIIRGNSVHAQKLSDSIQNALIITADSSDSLYALRVQCALLLIWQELLPMLSRNSVFSTGYDRSMQLRMRQMLSYIHAHYGERITLSDIAASAGVSEREASRCFSLCIQTSPVKYLNQVRIREAEKLLSQTDLSISAVAEATGFDSPGYFAKTFRAKNGITPKGFRARQIPGYTTA